VFDPTNGSSQNVLGQFTSLFAATLLLAANGHLVMIDALARSYHVVPIGAELHAEGLFAMARGGAILFALGLQFAAPVIAMVLVGHTALAVLSRAAPQLNVLSVAFPIHICIGLFSLAATVPIVAAFFDGWGSRYDGMLSAYLVPLAHGTVR
jgi:flagellar biosynthetic protein FliR